jgi:hypothetical protein
LFYSAEDGAHKQERPAGERLEQSRQQQQRQQERTTQQQSTTYWQ